MREIDRLRKDLRDFGNDGHVSKMLRMIFKYDLDDEQGFNGWEKWLQFELALFMDKQREVDGSSKARTGKTTASSMATGCKRILNTDDRKRVCITLWN